jgi:Raf kinase inhibitor-like YbhB/YbcL family protein
VLTRLLAVYAAGLAMTGCGGSHPSAPEPSKAPRSLEVSSPAFADGKPIPTSYTCKGAGGSPELSWSGVPEDARALALVVDDPDAPNGTYTHWVVVDIPPDVADVGAGAAPAGGSELKASGGVGWKPPCPPSGVHHYRFNVYALSSALDLPRSASLDDVVEAIASNTIAWGRLTGTVTASGGDSGGGY